MVALSVLSLGVDQAMKVLIALNSAWNLLNFRSGLIGALVAEGHDVVAVSPDDGYRSQLDLLGCRFHPVSMQTQGVNPVQDLNLLLQYVGIIRREKPDVVLAYTVKPNVYCSLAAHLLNIPVINNVSGLGAVFIGESWVTSVVKRLYRVAFSRSKVVFFQNDDDRRFFVDERLVNRSQTALLPGSGIDLFRFAFSPVDGLRKTAPFRFLLVARMLYDKGVREYVEAARRLKNDGRDVECCLLGFVDVENPAAIPREEIERWEGEGVVRYIGVSDDVRREIRDADCIVLPSYREGTPKTLLEAAAIGRPIVTTDVPGCREVVENGYNGFLCRVKDSEDLAEKMRRMFLISDEERRELAENGRKKTERQFDERFVIERYKKAIAEVVGGKGKRKGF